MYEFIYWVKAIAALLITNSHYTNVWPIPSMAFGGQLGNCLFFFVSGFCLCNIHEPFHRWYAKRVLRIFPAVWITTIIYVFAKYFYITSIDRFFYYFIFPTGFHFVGSIALLYIVFYVIRLLQMKLGIETKWIMLVTFWVFISLYILFCDKTSYHIDSVAERWVLFMFFESMIAGSVMREQYEKIGIKAKPKDIILLILLFVLYYCGKKLFSNFTIALSFQCMQPIIVSSLAIYIGYVFVKLDKGDVLHAVNKRFRKIVKFISTITLEIYLGQDLIVTIFRNIKFPLSFICVTGSILIYATILHYFSEIIRKRSQVVFHL